jgi:hypothetical protein
MPPKVGRFIVEEFFFFIGRGFPTLGGPYCGDDRCSSPLDSSFPAAATEDEQGAKCVWCTIASFGLCVSEEIAEKMKGQIPGKGYYHQSGSCLGVELAVGLCVSM